MTTGNAAKESVVVLIVRSLGAAPEQFPSRLHVAPPITFVVVYRFGILTQAVPPEFSASTKVYRRRKFKSYF